MIGVFDSGSGGLTVLKEIVARNPYSDVVYFGDLLNVPYGSKSPQELRTLTASAIKFVRDYGASGVVSACNSVSKTILDAVTDEFSVDRIHVIEMVVPTVEYLQSKGFKKVAVVATSATINADIYQSSGREVGIGVYGIALPNLAMSIEQGANEEQIEKIIEPCIHYVMENKINTLILGCTQFPLVQHTFQNMFDRNKYSVTIINPAKPVAEKVAKEFNEEEEGVLTFFISKDSLFFKEKVKEFFPKYKSNVHVIDNNDTQ